MASFLTTSPIFWTFLSSSEGLSASTVCTGPILLSSTLDIYHANTALEGGSSMLRRKAVRHMNTPQCTRSSETEKALFIEQTINRKTKQFHTTQPYMHRGRTLTVKTSMPQHDHKNEPFHDISELKIAFQKYRHLDHWQTLLFC